MKVFQIVAQKASYLRMVEKKRENEEPIPEIVIKMEYDYGVHLENLIRIFFPHGSGFNDKYEVELTDRGILKISSTFTSYSEAGFEQYIDFKIIVKPNLVFGFRLDVIQLNKKRYMDIIDFSNRQSHLSYIGETFEEVLNTEVILDNEGRVIH